MEANFPGSKHLMADDSVGQVRGARVTPYLSERAQIRLFDKRTIVFLA